MWHIVGVLNCSYYCEIWPSISSCTHSCWCKFRSLVRHPFERYSAGVFCRSCSCWRLSLSRRASFCRETSSRRCLSCSLSFRILFALFSRSNLSRRCLPSSVSFWIRVAKLSRCLCSRCCLLLGFVLNSSSEILSKSFQPVFSLLRVFVT